MVNKYAFNGFLFTQRATGVMRYAKEIIKVIDRESEKDEFSLVVPEYIKDLPVLNNIETIKYGSTHGNLWEQIDFVKYLHANKKVSVNFNNTMPIFSPGIITIHDVAYKIHPEFSTSLHGKLSNYYHQIIFKLVSYLKVPIVTVSYFSKYQIIDEYKINPMRITVIGNAWQHMAYVTEEDSRIMKEYNIKKKEYYFSLGSLSKMKNTKWIFEVAKKNKDDIFVLGGAIPNNCQLEEFPSLPNVKLLGYISDAQIKTLIKKLQSFYISVSI